MAAATATAAEAATKEMDMEREAATNSRILFSLVHLLPQKTAATRPRSRSSTSRAASRRNSATRPRSRSSSSATCPRSRSSTSPPAGARRLPHPRDQRRLLTLPISTRDLLQLLLRLLPHPIPSRAPLDPPRLSSTSTNLPTRILSWCKAGPLNHESMGQSKVGRVGAHHPDSFACYIV